tara:strand:+ start:943 stop:1149 length:207 start_codon:yes stop_codon:yes gene_type:complete
MGMGDTTRLQKELDGITRTVGELRERIDRQDDALAGLVNERKLKKEVPKKIIDPVILPASKKKKPTNK